MLNGGEPMGKVLFTLGLLLGAAPALAQGRPAPADTAVTITVPVPEVGAIYVRYGPPGGVRIRSRRGLPRVARRPLAPPRPTPADALVQRLVADAAAEARLSRQDRDRLEIDIRRRLGGFDTLGGRLGGARLRLTPRGPVIVVLDEDDPNAPPDTLFLDRLEPGPSGGAPPPQAEVPPDYEPLAPPDVVDRVERSLLGTGVLRSLNVNFAFDESRILPAAEPTLAAVADVLQRYPQLRLEVVGHTDAIGSAAYNERLSQRRAASVERYLTDQLGVDASRLSTRGVGESQHIATNNTPTGRALNRRVEFRIVDGVTSDE